jgi:hypothetical protein
MGFHCVLCKIRMEGTYGYHRYLNENAKCFSHIAVLLPGVIFCCIDNNNECSLNTSQGPLILNGFLWSSLVPSRKCQDSS